MTSVYTKKKRIIRQSEGERFARELAYETGEWVVLVWNPYDAYYSLHRMDDYANYDHREVVYTAAPF